MSKNTEQLFHAMLDEVRPYIKEERDTLYFQGEFDEGWDIIVSYTSKINGARLYLPELDRLVAPFTGLVDLCQDGGRGIPSKCTFSLNNQGEVGLEIEYTEVPVC